MNKKRVFPLVCLLLAGTAQADENAVASSPKSACMEGPLAQFGRYIGDWKITDEELEKDGSSWSPGDGARWTFMCVGDGLGVQDYWMPNTGGFGTNLRIYNPDTESWEIVWAATPKKGFTHISAKQNDQGDIVMDFVSPKPNPPRRITFFAPEDAGWKWVMEMSFDEGESWTAVYRISATPWDS